MMLLAAFALILANAFFVLSEFSLVKIRKSRLEELVKDGVAGAKLALSMSHSLDTYLSANQLGITLSSLALGWIGEPAIAHLIEPVLAAIGVASAVAVHSVAVVIAFVFITLLHVVLGELVPKSIAIAKTERVVLLIARPLHIFWVIFFPFIRAFDLVAALVLRAFGVQPAKESELAHSEEEIKIIANESLQGGVIDNLESEIIKNAVDFGGTVAKEIMTPRKDIICLKKQNSLGENLRIVSENKFTRYPYIDENKDAVIGMIHIRDVMLRMVEVGAAEVDLGELVRKFIIVPENSSVSKILAMMNKARISAALVVDEYGGTAGLLTMEDIIEEIVGDLNDEHDEDEADYRCVGEGAWEFAGRVEIDEIEAVTGREFDDETEQQTIGGYVLNLFERLPEVGEKIADAQFDFEVLAVENNSIGAVRASLAGAGDAGGANSNLNNANGDGSNSNLTANANASANLNDNANADGSNSNLTTGTSANSNLTTNGRAQPRAPRPQTPSNSNLT